MADKKIIVKIEGGSDAVLELTSQDVDTAKGILTRSGLKEIYCIKHKGAAMFFTNEGAAINCQNRNQVEYMFVLDSTLLADKAEAKTENPTK